jgi:hypothetical protein
MTKTQEIVQKLQSGTTAKDLIREGYSHGLVYKLNRQYKEPMPFHEGNNITNAANNKSQAAIGIDGDQEISTLKREVTKAELKKRLAEVTASTDIWPVIADLECKLAQLEEDSKQQSVSIADLQVITNTAPLSDLIKGCQCKCGTKGFLALKLYCIGCGEEYWCTK